MTVKFWNKTGANLEKQVQDLTTANASLTQEIEALKKQPATDVQAQLATSLASITALTTERDTFKAEVGTITAQLNTITAQLDEANKKYTALEQTKAEVKTEELNKGVAQALASKGLPDGTIPAEPQAKLSPTPEGILVQIKALRSKSKNKEADALWKEHRALFNKQ